MPKPLLNKKQQKQKPRLFVQKVWQANRIIGQSLKGNEEYLNYLWINNIEKSNSEKIYIPTEAGMPILEARNK